MRRKARRQRRYENALALFWLACSCSFMVCLTWLIGCLITDVGADPILQENGWYTGAYGAKTVQCAQESRPLEMELPQVQWEPVRLTGTVSPEKALPTEGADHPGTQADAAALKSESEDGEIQMGLPESAVRLDQVTVSHYCICSICCGKEAGEPGYGITASGVPAEPGVSIAVDPAVIPLGSTVAVDYGDGELHYYRADDTGSNVDGSHIDLCMESHEAALRAGIKTATIWWWEK